MQKYTVEFTVEPATSPSAELNTSPVYADSFGKAEQYIMRIHPRATILAIFLTETQDRDYLDSDCHLSQLEY